MYASVHVRHVLMASQQRITSVTMYLHCHSVHWSHLGVFVSSTWQSEQTVNGLEAGVHVNSSLQLLTQVRTCMYTCCTTVLPSSCCVVALNSLARGHAKINPALVILPSPGERRQSTFMPCYAMDVAAAVAEQHAFLR